MSAFRFSLRELLTLTILVAITAGAMRANSLDGFMLLFAFHVLLGAAVLLTLLFGAEENRAYWRGALLFGGLYTILSLAPWFREAIGEKTLPRVICDRFIKTDASDSTVLYDQSGMGAWSANGNFYGLGAPGQTGAPTWFGSGLRIFSSSDGSPVLSFPAASAQVGFAWLLAFFGAKLGDWLRRREASHVTPQGPEPKKTVSRPRDGVWWGVYLFAPMIVLGLCLLMFYRGLDEWTVATMVTLSIAVTGVLLSLAFDGPQRYRPVHTLALAGGVVFLAIALNPVDGVCFGAKLLPRQFAIWFPDPQDNAALTTTFSIATAGWQPSSRVAINTGMTWADLSSRLSTAPSIDVDTTGVVDVNATGAIVVDATNASVGGPTQPSVSGPMDQPVSDVTTGPGDASPLGSNDAGGPNPGIPGAAGPNTTFSPPVSSVPVAQTFVVTSPFAAITPSSRIVRPSWLIHWPMAWVIASLCAMLGLLILWYQDSRKTKSPGLAEGPDASIIRE